MGVWGEINAARGSRGGIYLLPADNGGEANYRVRLTRCIANKDRKGVDQFICEMTVLTTTQPKRAVGSHPSTCIKLNKDAAPGNVADICRAGLAALACQVIAAGPEAVADLVKVLRTPAVEMGETAALIEAAAAEGAPVDMDTIVLSEKGVQDWIGGEENPLGDLELDVIAYNRDTAEKKPFTRLIWAVPADVSALAQAEEAA